MAEKQVPTKASGDERVSDVEAGVEDRARRETMRKLGKMAVYTAPALLALMTQTTQAQAASLRV